MVKSMNEIKSMSEEDLEKYLDTAEYDTIGRDLAMQELMRRRLRLISKPHWTLTPGFWVILLAMIFAAIAAWPVIRDFFREPQAAGKAANSPQQQLQSTPSKQPEPKSSDASNHPSNAPSK